jgi:hypothetical protein
LTLQRTTEPRTAPGAAFVTRTPSSAASNRATSAIPHQAAISPAPPTDLRAAAPSQILALQSTIGNAAVRRQLAEQARSRPLTPTERIIAENRLRTNLQSWDAWVIDRIDGVVSDLFADEEEALWWMTYAADVVNNVVGMLDPVVPQIITNAVYAVATLSAHMRQLEINRQKSDLSAAAKRELVRYRDRRRREGETQIAAFRGTGEPLPQIVAEIERSFPMLTEDNYGQLEELVDRVMEAVREAKRAQERAAERMRFVRQVAVLLGIPGDRAGYPSDAEVDSANAQARSRTGYTGPPATLEEVFASVDPYRARAEQR